MATPTPDCQPAMARSAGLSRRLGSSAARGVARRAESLNASRRRPRAWSPGAELSMKAIAALRRCSTGQNPNPTCRHPEPSYARARQLSTICMEYRSDICDGGENNRRTASDNHCGKPETLPLGERASLVSSLRLRLRGVFLSIHLGYRRRLPLTRQRGLFRPIQPHHQVDRAIGSGQPVRFFILTR
jgi:hypothetical protein